MFFNVLAIPRNTMKGKYILDTLYVISWFHTWFASIVLILFLEENQKPETFWVLFFLISEALGKSNEVSSYVAYFSKDIHW